MGDIIETITQEVEAITTSPVTVPADHEGLRESLALTRKALRWGITQDMRDRMPLILWAMVNNEALPPKPRREAMKILAMIEAQNQKDDYIAMSAKRNSINMTINTAVAKVELSSPERAIQAAGLIDGKVNIPEPPKAIAEIVRPGECLDETPEVKPIVVDIPSVKEPS